MEAVRRLEEKKHNTDRVRAGGTGSWRKTPDPRTSRALAEAASDKSWIVRAAVLEAIAQNVAIRLFLETAAQADVRQKKGTLFDSPPAAAGPSSFPIS